jgi:hypothetical protein
MPPRRKGKTLDELAGGPVLDQGFARELLSSLGELMCAIATFVPYCLESAWGRAISYTDLPNVLCDPFSAISRKSDAHFDGSGVLLPEVIDANVAIE